jgi:hypothetical protein
MVQSGATGRLCDRTVTYGQHLHAEADPHPFIFSGGSVAWNLNSPWNGTVGTL